MTSLLRQTAAASLLCRGLAPTCRARLVSVRPAKIPRHLFYTPRIRYYATTPPEGPRPEDKSAQRSIPDGWVRFSKEDLSAIEKHLKGLRQAVPAPFRDEFDKVLKVLLDHGAAPPTVAAFLKDFDGTMNPFKMFKVMPELTKLILYAEDRMSNQENQKQDTLKMASEKGSEKSAKQSESTSAKDGSLEGMSKPQDTKPTDASESQSTSSENKAKATEGEPAQKTSSSPGPSDPKDKEQDGDKKKRSKGQRPDDGRVVFRANLDLQTLLIAAFSTFMFYRLIGPQGSSREITWQEFKNNFFDKGLVEKLVVTESGTVNVHLHREAVASMYPDSPAVNPGFYYYFTIGSVEAFERKVEDAQKELGIPSSERIPVQYAREGIWGNLLIGFGPTLLFIAAIVWMSRRAASGGGGQAGGIFGMGRSRAKKFNHETDIKVKFADVAGMDEAKQEIMEFVSFLRDPGMYQKLGAKIPRGAILSGPPGTGKTLLAKATAGESGVPFFSVSGSEFVEMFVGVGASRVRDLFQNARKSTPCIIFIDEIDAIGKSRSSGKFSGGGNDEREATLNQILTEMDGFNTSEQVVVLAGTNRADILDSALLRPGRFDRHIAIDKPTMDGRKQIFKVHLRNIVTNVDTEYLEGRLAALTPGFSGADIANCVNEAALIAARQTASTVEMSHFEQAIERVIGGLEKRSLVLSPEEKKTVAYHEAGHAICGWFFQWADPLLKVSIIPRGQGALGYAQYLPAGDTYLLNVNQIMDRLAMTLGGRVSEELHFDTVTSGASDDFNKVTRMATAMVTKWGMSPKIGYRYYEDDQQNQLHKPFSEETARDIDLEVRRIVDEAYEKCKTLLKEKKAEVGIVAEELLRKEMLTRDDMIRLLGPRPFPDKEEFAKYFSGARPGGKGDRDGRDSTVPGAQGSGDVPGGAAGNTAPPPAPTA